MQPGSGANADYLAFDKGVFRYLVGGNSGGGNRTVAPIAIDLGIKRNGTHETDPKKDGSCIKDLAVWPDPQLAPPLNQCSGYLDGHARAAYVDDSGRLVIRDNKKIDHTIWCVGLVANPNGYAANNCPYDVSDQHVSTHNGAGFLYIHDQCIVATYLTQPCDSTGYSKWYLGAGMYNGTTSTARSKGTTSLTDLMDKETSTGYLQKGFYSHLDSRNTQPGGFAAYNYYTLQYPNNAATCSYNRTNNNIDVTYTNTGTRIWRDIDGYIVRVKANGLITPYRFAAGDLKQQGDTKTFPGISIPATGSYTIELDQDKNGSSSPNTNANYINNDNNYERIIINCSPQTALACRVDTIPASGEVGSSFTYTVTIQNNGAIASTGPVDVDLVQPSGSHASNYPRSIPLNHDPPPNGGTGTTASISHTPTQAGSYTFNIGYAGLTFSGCGQITVGAKPYMRVYHGDVIAGTYGTCTAWGNNPSAGLLGFNNGVGGTGSQIGSLALGSINGFSSAILWQPPTSGSHFPYGLAFASVGSGGPGNLGNYDHCAYDYWNNKSSAPQNLPDLNSLGNKNGDFLYSGTLPAVVNAPQTINDGNCGPSNATRFINVYVPGDLHIDQPVTYANAGSWGQACQVPRLQFIVHGNIYINSGVTQLDGIYVAQPPTRNQGSGGTIYTCSQNGAVPANSSIYATCNNQLTVNGAFIAKQVKWLRTFGSLSNSGGSNEYPGGSTPATCTVSGGPVTRNSCAGEIINFSPETYINQTPASGDTIGTKFDFITALPPLL